MKSRTIHALVTAAGTSQRFGADQPKQYMLLRGRPVLAHSIDALRQHARVKAVHVTLPADDYLFQDMLATRYKDVLPVTGGASRAESVLIGLNHIARIDPECDWVLVHDAARPCLSPAALDRLLEQVGASPDGGILAAPVVDTLKRGDNQNIIETVDRTSLWAAQTPQYFPLQPLMNAIGNMLEQGLMPTDEAGAMEHAGYRPKLIEGDSKNVKVTVAADLEFAEFILSQRHGSPEGSGDA